MTEKKSIFLSKTFWFSIITIAIGVLDFIEGQSASGATLTAVGVINVLLRLVTKEAAHLWPE